VIALALLAAGCVRPEPPAPDTMSASIPRWWRDLGDYAERRQRFAWEAARLREEFLGLRAEPEFLAVEEKVRDLADRIRAGARADASEIVVGSLYRFALAELVLFQQLLALSTRLVSLEATLAELESVRLELWLRRLRTGRDAGPGTWADAPHDRPDLDARLVEQPASLPLTCARHSLGTVEVVSCQ
jgi:hypothetical protein